VQNKKVRKTLVLSVVDAFSYIAVWQGAVFVVLILLVWFNELVDLPAVCWGQPHRSLSLVRGCVATAGVLVAAIITVGNTYLQQKNIVSGMLTICCCCHRIRLDHQMWERVEQYIGAHSSVLFTHGVCPECYEKAKATELGGPTAASPTTTAPSGR